MKNNFNIYTDPILDNYILNICDLEYNYFLNKTNVVGIAMGYKRMKGKISNKKCLVIFVSKKVPIIELSSNNIIPTKYKGVMTDVVESGLFTTEALTSKIRPSIGGYSIASIFGNDAGTFGCLVTDTIDNYILSCNHVLALKNRARLFTPITQPAIFDGGNPQTDIIALLSKFIPLKFITPTTRPENLSDCAIAELLRADLALPSIAYMGKPKGTRVPILGEEVKKVGRTTELTNGIILYLGASMEVDTQTPRPFLLKKQIITTKMSKAGDSGSILLNKDNYALGLLVGSAPTYSLFSLIDITLNLLGVYLVTE